MRGYLNRPAETAQMLDADGWLRTGDIGHVDDDGYFYVVDRVKELIKYKGLQVAPAELEAVLVAPADRRRRGGAHPDEEAGEVPKAFVVATAELSAQEVMDYVAERVAPTSGSASRVHRRDPQVAVGQDPAARAHGTRPADDGQLAKLAPREGMVGPRVGLVILLVIPPAATWQVRDTHWLDDPADVSSQNESGRHTLDEGFSTRNRKVVGSTRIWQCQSLRARCRFSGRCGAPAQ